jgi:hypothetical protein
VDFDDLKVALVAELEKCRKNGSEGIIVVYGQCHPKIEEILAPYHAALAACQNCVDAFITLAFLLAASASIFLALPRCTLRVLPPSRQEAIQ